MILAVDAAHLAQRRQRTDVVRRLARAEWVTLAQQMAGSHLLRPTAWPGPLGWTPGRG